jgi:hypothetical protein
VKPLLLRRIPLQKVVEIVEGVVSDQILVGMILAILGKARVARNSRSERQLLKPRIMW